MKYGKYEYERSYLVDGAIFENMEVECVKKINDKYIRDTTLRLRRVEIDGNFTYKLTQKEKLNPSKHGILKINTFYLSETEYDTINQLDGVEINKVRSIYTESQVRMGVDEIELDGQSIHIAEVEFSSELEMQSFELPAPFIREITGENQFNGYELAKVFQRTKL